MKLPVLAFGNEMLFQDCEEIGSDYPGLDELIDDMWDTLSGADGVGLAAPQVDRGIRLFIVDSQKSYAGMNRRDRKLFFDGDTGIRETFINPHMDLIEERSWKDTEGCLSMPGITEEIERPWAIRIDYYNRNFERQEKQFSGLTARMIQHEYDHTRGILFLEYLGSFRRTLLKTKLKDIAMGNIKTSYKMKFI